MSDYETIRYERDEELLMLTLSRPDRHNGFTVTMAEELIDAYARAGKDDAVSAIVVSGDGKNFCVGMDLSAGGNVFGLDESLRPTLEDMQRRPVAPEIESGVRDTGGRVTLAMYDCPKPIVGALHGAAVGIGSTMTLAMDFRFAADTLRMGFVFGRLGIVPEACSTWFLPRLVGIERALELFYRAEIIDAATALRYGLVRQIVPEDAVVPTACAFAREIVAGRSQLSMALIRQMVLHNSAQPHPRAAHDIESLAVFETSLGDGKEGVAAFLEKRPPRFAATASQMPRYFDEG